MTTDEIREILATERREADIGAWYGMAIRYAATLREILQLADWFDADDTEHSIPVDMLLNAITEKLGETQ